MIALFRSTPRNFGAHFLQPASLVRFGFTPEDSAGEAPPGSGCTPVAAWVGRRWLRTVTRF